MVHLKDKGELSEVSRTCVSFQAANHALAKKPCHILLIVSSILAYTLIRIVTLDSSNFR